MTKDRFFRVLSHRLFWPIAMLVTLLLVDEVRIHDFLSIEMKQGHLYGSLIDILQLAAPLIVVSVGMTVVIATKGIDLSVGAVVAISGAMACLYISKQKDQGSLATVLTAAVLALALSALLGVWNGLLVAVFGIQPIIATLILMVAGRGLAELITNGFIISVTSPKFAMIGTGYWLALPFPILIDLAIVIASALLIRRSALGVLIEAVGGNAEASRLAGVQSRRLIWLVYIFCGVCAGVAGLMISSYTSAADGNNAGLWIELDAILAVVLGGTQLSGGRFSIGGTVVGALLLQTLTTSIYTIGVPPETNMLVKSLVITVVCLLQSPDFRAKVTKPFKGPKPKPVERPVDSNTDAVVPA